ncbi:Ligand of Numb protein X 2, partial [Fusarium oxysporum f. sp. albedinis]
MLIVKLLWVRALGVWWAIKPKVMEPILLPIEQGTYRQRRVAFLWRVSLPHSHNIIIIGYSHILIPP